MRVRQPSPKSPERAPYRRECARSPWLPWSLGVLSTAEPGAYRSGLSSGLHCPALPDMDFRDRASSNCSSNIVSESGSTDFVEDLVRLQAEAAADDFFLDLGSAAEDRRGQVAPRWAA